MADQTDNRTIPESKTLDEFQEKFLRLPDYAQDWMCSLEAAENNAQIAAKFRMSREKNPIVAKLTGDVILKDATVEALPELLQENLKVDPQTARQIALDIALKQLLIVRGHLRAVEGFIIKLGGTLPAALPSIEAVKSAITTETILPTYVVPAKKPFRLAVQENKEILNQLLTANPIKIADFEQPVRPTIKNWLSDYIKHKGTGYHDEMERSDYLYKSSNAINLPGEERAKLSKILRAYDEDSEVPVSSENKLILIEELAKKEAPPLPKAVTQTPAPTPSPYQPPSAPLPPTAPPPQPPPAARPFMSPPIPSPTPAASPPPLPKTGLDTYREPVNEEDLEGPLKPPVKPAPRLEGNVVDLKNLDELK